MRDGCSRALFHALQVSDRLRGVERSNFAAKHRRNCEWVTIRPRDDVEIEDRRLRERREFTQSPRRVGELMFPIAQSKLDRVVLVGDASRGDAL